MSEHRHLLVLASLPLLAVGWMLPVGFTGVTLLVAAQLCILASCMVEGRVSAQGSFVFMYVLFFAFRPVYFFIEHDWLLMTRLFRVPKDLEIPYEALRWAALCIVCFRLGTFFPGARRPPSAISHYLRRERQAVYILNPRDVVPLLALQLFSLLVLNWAVNRTGGLYGFGTGYVYDLPVPLQAVHAFAVMFILQMWRMDRRNKLLTFALVASMVLFVTFTITMRSVSIFRLFYLTGFMALAFAYLLSRGRRVSYVWLVVPVLLGMPFFDALGRLRMEETATAGQQISSNIGEMLQPKSYWDFFEGTRDMNIFDSYTAALLWEPQHHPYFLQWAYPAVHWVPRKIWKGKPPGGMLIDLAGPMRGAPYSPGINGIFYLGGGRTYMLISMAMLGYCISRLNATILAMKEGVLKWAFYGTFVVNTMLLTRFFLFQFVWQVLYVAVPCILLNYLLIKKLHLRKPRRAQALKGT